MTGRDLAGGVPVLRRLGGAEVPAVRDRLVETYTAVFCAPPWDDSPARAVRFAELLDGWARQPGFVAVLADDAGRETDAAGRGTGADGAPVTGFALGLPTPAPFPADRAYGQVRRLLGPAVETLSDWLEVAELAVHPVARRAGLGRRLLAELTADRPAWLLTVPTVAGTTDFYDAAGWIRHGTGYGITIYTNRPLSR
ncbi:N-acetyltransferase [Plantactinospora endophytica]|uniref:N-acetyltransferase n=1 Tax=Plantactinospora endophytica TaxID=673535 RepID=A0ABQ4E1U9_9ACTN|nr:GNAT family N-acetyltransferase [Plantactinospora endophytica]GIG88694.1 N-acetyltransferase [Plantactinospora endophytica]